MTAFTGVVALSALVYAILTWRLVSETRRMREAQTEPRVSVRVELHHSGAYGYELIICNEGQGVANNVRFEFEGDPSYFRNSFVLGVWPTVDQLPVIKKGLDFLEPGQIFRFPIGTVSEEEFDRATGAPWTFQVQYENLYGKRKKAAYIVDFSQFRGMVFEPNALKEIEKHLDSIREDLNRLTKGNAKVQVVAQSRKEFLKEREDYRAQSESSTTDSSAPSNKKDSNGS